MNCPNHPDTELTFEVENFNDGERSGLIAIMDDPECGCEIPEKVREEMEVKYATEAYDFEP